MINWAAQARRTSTGRMHLANSTAMSFFSHLRVGDGVQVLR